MKNDINNLIRWYILHDNDNNFDLTISQPIISFIHYHKLDGILFEYLKKHNALLPNKVINNINQINQTNTNYEDLILSLASKFDESNLQYALLKGGALYNYLYSKKYHRIFSDIDILVSANDLQQTENLIQAMGFVQGQEKNGEIELATRRQIIYQRLYTHEIYNYVKKYTWGFANIDINFCFSWKAITNDYETATEIPVEIALSTPQKIFNKSVATLNNELQFIHLCCHLYNEAVFFALDKNFQGGDPKELCLNRILDIMLLLHKYQLDKTYIFNLCNKYHCLYKIEYALYAINELFPFFDIQFDYDIRTATERINRFYNQSAQCQSWPLSLNDRIFNLEKRTIMLKNMKFI